MAFLANILLAAVDGYGELIGIAILIVIAIVGGIAKKASESAAARKAQQEASDRSSSQPKARPQQTADRAREGSPQDLRRVRAQALRRMGIVATPPQPRTPPAPPPAPPAPPPERRRRPAAGEVEQHGKSIMRRKRGLAERAPQPEAVSAPAAIESAYVNRQVDLSDIEAARKAIVYREVLGPPKALRDEPEIWDT